jgi:hypothetical protein
MKTKILAAIYIVFLAGCSPIPLAYGPRSVTFDNVTKSNINESQIMADNHCRRHGKYAVPIDYGNYTVTYECKN